MAFEIFANHAHVYPKEIMEHGSTGALRKMMDTCGISRAVAFAPFPHRVKALGAFDPNRWLCDEIRNDDRLVGFGVVDFAAGKLKEQVEEIGQLGLKGIKLHPAAQCFKIDSEGAFAVYAKAEELGLFLSFHSGIHGYRLAHDHPILFDEVACAFPTLKFSMEHVGGYCFFKDVLAVMLNNMRRGPQPRIYAGLTSVHDREKHRMWYLDDAQLYDLLRLTGDDSSMLGLDFPFNSEEQTKSAIQRIAGLDISDEAKGKILGGNLKAALGV